MARTATMTSRGGQLSGLEITQIDWVADETDGSFAAWEIAGIVQRGQLIAMDTYPDGVTAPTNLYDVTLKDPRGLDVLGGEEADRSSTVIERAVPSFPPADPLIPSPFDCPLDFEITGNSVNSAEGTIILYWLRF